MASRNQRLRSGVSAERTRGMCRPGTTRAQALREAKSAAMINSRLEPPAIPRRVRTGLARATSLEPKRLDFSKPGMTKSLMARMQHVQKLKEAEEHKRRQEEAAANNRRPRRTVASQGGDARLGREKSALHESGLRSGSRKMMQEDFQQSLKEQSRRTIPGSRLPVPDTGKRRQSMGHQRSVVADAANRSIQVIQETLDEQDVAECVVVQNKLQDLQNARRDFVLAIANVSSNAVSFADDLNTSIPLPGSPLSYQSGPLPQEKSPSRFIYKLPEVDDSYFHVDMDRHQAIMSNARQFLNRQEEAHGQREAQRRIDEEFARVAAHIDDDDFRYDIPFEQDIMEGDISFEEDDDGTIFPCQSRIKASMPPIPRRRDDYAFYNNNNINNYATSADNIDELERFFDTTNYPVVASSRNEQQKRSRRNREYLHPDFVDIEDPWYRECPPNRDLIDFDLMEFSK
ncbi:uncharacterized protein LOC127282624 [Leptopilina boulardi]|uniref:uncharacterized protein LOC127282624 n=1 Tax=Leptopilina boulardi TaxID=63433 RepID=UPI0021F64586|nr:uncharacterized protein LOC127282624 [Leptopilina boulardi]